MLKLRFDWYITWLAGDVKEPTRLPKRVGQEVPGVVVYLSMYGSGEIKNGLITAASGALYRKICKIGPEKPQGECPITSNVPKTFQSVDFPSH